MKKRLDEHLASPTVYKKTDGFDTKLDMLKNGIPKHKNHIFTFLKNVNIPPTNNGSKKTPRPIKAKLHVIG